MKWALVVLRDVTSFTRVTSWLLLFYFLFYLASATYFLYVWQEALFVGILQNF